MPNPEPGPDSRLPPHSDANAGAPIPAGEFGAWLANFRAALRDDREADVPCGDCSGCCTSSYAIVLRPHETAAARAIPPEFLVRDPHDPAGRQLVGYDARGHCPMLRDGLCSIYAHRPLTCRTYDCRVFAAAGIDPGGAERAAITARTRRWQFSYGSEDARRAHDAVRRAARFVRDDAPSFGGRAPSRPNAIAMTALAAYELFVEPVPESTAAKRELAERVLAAARG
jgi:Fe-S-cluster containining protein